MPDKTVQLVTTASEDWIHSLSNVVIKPVKTELELEQLVDVEADLMILHLSELPNQSWFEQRYAAWPFSQVLCLEPEPQQFSSLDLSHFRVLHAPWTIEQLQQWVDELTDKSQALCHQHELMQRIEEKHREMRAMNSTLEYRVRKKAKQLTRAVYYDVLTGLPTKSLLLDRLEQAVNEAQQETTSLAVMSIGLPNFKRISETFSEEISENTLTELTSRLQELFPSQDLARIADDEFALILTEVDNDQLVSKANQLIEAIAQPISIENQSFSINAHVGISVYPNDATEHEELLRNAHNAMRQALRSQQSTQFFSSQFNEIARRRASLETQLRDAIKNEEFILYYQPRVDVNTGLIAGVEALLRWQHPAHGLMAPNAFLPVLEETGMIDPVGEWVLHEACQALKRWHEAALPSIRMAVNLSAKQFRHGYVVNMVSNVLQRAQIDPSDLGLELEITESLLMEDVVSARQSLHQLHDMGINLAIDDFGTGYSSLNYLIQFPIQYLKIDRSFVFNMLDSHAAKAIVEAIVLMAHSLSLKVIAEGVETQEQLDLLQRFGCRQFQGYLFSMPLPEDNVKELLLADAQLVHLPDQNYSPLKFKRS